VPNIKSEFARAIRMPITNTEQGTTSEAHDIGGNFNDLGAVNCSTASNRCGADFVESRAKLGLDRPPFERYVVWMAGFLVGDLGISHTYGVPVSELMASLFEAIVQQNLSVLTRGHTLRPTVLLLGGPNLLFFSALWAINIAYKYARLWSDGYDWRDVFKQSRDRMIVDVAAETLDDAKAIFSKEKRAEVRERDRRRRLSMANSPVPGGGAGAAAGLAALGSSPAPS